MSTHNLNPSPVSVFQRYAKAFAALAGAATPAAVIVVLGLVGVTVDQTVAAVICTVLAAVATLLGPANVEPAPELPPPPVQGTYPVDDEDDPEDPR
ncbi:hypothetical protein CFN78_06730 [Amycolatopsis antarctica]|uniref:Holin n=1 Tax=Amycolatopsis antarctica TaxID=1854586 RepID=A0A263D8V2_9PSEU|nr:hypothetical protein [Amycolatopsis antarctica]OZM73977.1 hypothetical protein CFN78_06730 [Amycolatopsis antarctica]